MNRLFRTLALASMMLAFVQSRAASAAEQADSLQRTLQKRLDLVYGTIFESGDANKMVQQLLADDAVMTASDGPKVWRGPGEALEVAQELIKTYKTIKATAVWTKAAGHDAAYQFVVFKLTPRNSDQAPPIPNVAKSLYVWVKTSKGWRIAADHFSYTGMDTPR